MTQEFFASILSLEGIQIKLHISSLHQLNRADSCLFQLSKTRGHLELFYMFHRTYGSSPCSCLRGLYISEIPFQFCFFVSFLRIILCLILRNDFFFIFFFPLHYIILVIIFCTHIYFFLNVPLVHVSSLLHIMLVVVHVLRSWSAFILVLIFLLLLFWIVVAFMRFSNRFVCLHVLGWPGWVSVQLL